MPAQAPVQDTICDRLDRAIAIIVNNGGKPAAIYLDVADRDELSAEATRFWREQSGSEAFVWPCSYDDLPLIAEKLIQHFEIPVRLRTGCNTMRSTVYGSNGIGVPLDRI